MDEHVDTPMSVNSTVQPPTSLFFVEHRDVAGLHTFLINRDHAGSADLAVHLDDDAALMEACGCGLVNAVVLLVVVFSFPPTASHIAHACHCGYPECVNILLSSGAGLDSDPGLLTTMLRQCTDPAFANRDNLYGHTSPDNLLDDRCAIVTRLVLLPAVSVDYHDDHYAQTALMYAAKYHRRVCSILLNAGADVNAVNRNGTTALHKACDSPVVNDACAVIELLVERGANIEHQSYSHRTPLHWAVYHANLSTIDTLMSMGADMEAETYNGEAALPMARRYNATHPTYGSAVQERLAGWKLTRMHDIASEWVRLAKEKRV